MISQIKTGSESAEAELLVHCARLEIDPARAERIRSLAVSNLNWTKLVRAITFAGSLQIGPAD
jgi:hypothetical protein